MCLVASDFSYVEKRTDVQRTDRHDETKSLLTVPENNLNVIIQSHDLCS